MNKATGRIIIGIIFIVLGGMRIAMNNGGLQIWGMLMLGYGLFTLGYGIYLFSQGRKE